MTSSSAFQENHNDLQLRRQQQQIRQDSQQGQQQQPISLLPPPPPKCVDAGLEVERRQVTSFSSIMSRDNKGGDDVSDEEDGFAACLIIMDDNHYLIEWLAYHYTVLPLKRLIVAIDPRSKTSPKAIFDRYRSRGLIDITEWYNETYYFPLQDETNRLSTKYLPNEPVEYEKEMHYSRQRYFYGKCMETLIEEYKEREHNNKKSNIERQDTQQDGSTSSSKTTAEMTNQKSKQLNPKPKPPLWTMFIDTDEYILYNQNVPLSRKQLLPYRANHTIYSTLETAKNVYLAASASAGNRKREGGDDSDGGENGGSLGNGNRNVNSGLDDADDKNWNNCDNLHHLGQTIVENPCMLIPRLTMGTKQLEEDVDNEESHLLPDISRSGSTSLNDVSNFITLSYRYHDGITNFNTNRHNKGIIDLSVIANHEETLPLIPELIVEVHSPIRQYCDKQGNNRIKRSSFVINHYFGTWEQWSYRDDIRRTREKYLNKSYNKGYDDSMIRIRQEQGLPSTATATIATPSPPVASPSLSRKDSHVWVQQLLDRVGNDHSIMEELLQGIGRV